MNFFRRHHRSSAATRTYRHRQVPDFQQPHSDDFLSFEDLQDVSLPAQVLPSMLDRTPGRRRFYGMALFTNSRFFSRRQHLPPPDLPSYEAMLALDENNPKRGVKSSVLNKLPAVSAKSKVACSECLICLEQPSSSTKVTKLPCGHLFCTPCIRTWLVDHRSCPVCRWEFADKETHLIIPK